MLKSYRFRILILAAVIVLALSATAVFAGAPAPAATPINDTPGDPGAPGVNIIRKVQTDNFVVVRLNRGSRAAHFNVILRGIKASDITDDFPAANGVDGGHTDGIFGVCGNDELVTNLGKSGEVAMAKFTTCGQHDSIKIHLSDPKIGNGSFPAIKIVFTEGVLDNVEGVFVGNDPTDVGNAWIPLYE